MELAVNPEPSLANRVNLCEAARSATGYATAGARDYSALSRPLLEHSDLLESEPLILTDQHHHTLTFKATFPADGSKKHKTVLEACLAEKGIERPLNSFLGLLDGDEYEIGKGLTEPEKIETWDLIQKKLKEFKSSGQVLSQQETIKLGQKYQQLQARDCHLNFLTSGWDLRHFYRSIKALSAQGQEKVVHAVMGKVLSHTREFFSLRGSQFSKRFAKIHQEFIELQPNFLGQTHSLSTKLDQAGPDTIDEVMKGSPITSFTEKLVDFFKEPELTTPNLEQRRIEYQLVYYMLNFIDQNHPRIISKTVKCTETKLPRTERDKH
ncbi:hypothetical protein PGT21_015206 [Puccinia graminis f. sp. tritici]|uniref:Uncharacterized protein n=1 Tax=Puccinia graminis f. sp. tritici TaxID=56615 RepID=A0A5B0MC48_PUCGR|nr:hypothetical protein PGT21_015206 [Puccinia graminis f. sp. tritici]